MSRQKRDLRRGGKATWLVRTVLAHWLGVHALLLAGFCRFLGRYLCSMQLQRAGQLEATSYFIRPAVQPAAVTPRRDVARAAALFRGASRWASPDLGGPAPRAAFGSPAQRPFAPHLHHSLRLPCAAACLASRQESLCLTASNAPR